ncbi:MAG: PIN domain-containing protein [Deltaproteobacteria bacterium]|nr:PIN domain-containing protein [Deltaproteobacteria bacterium]
MADEPLVFIDTNIIVYAHDRDAGHKRALAKQRLATLLTERRAVVSLQVLQELYVTLTRKLPKALAKDDARELVDGYADLRLVIPDVELLKEAMRLEARWQLSFWDAMIVAAADRAGCATVLSEDLGHGRKIAGVVIENPFV